VLFVRRAVGQPTITPGSEGSVQWERWSLRLPGGEEGPAYTPPAPDLRGRRVVLTHAPMGSTEGPDWPMHALGPTADGDGRPSDGPVPSASSQEVGDSTRKASAASAAVALLLALALVRGRLRR
jgi:hypothetical protein